MAGAQKPDPVSTKQQQIAELAKQDSQRGFTSLNHRLDLLWLAEAFHRTRKSAAPGVDGQTADDYELNLRANLSSLRDRAKSGAYWAPPVRRVRIPKGTGSETRPLGIPTLEDKVLQRAVVMALEPIYEQDFLDCSYGFRPGRSAHAALAALWRQTMDLGGCWLVEVDIQKFFDALDHAQLRLLLRQRVRDGVLLRLIDKWLKAGVLEDGELTYPEAGTPQGGCGLTATGQRLFALCAGRLVPGSGEALPQGSRLPGTLRGRLRHKLLPVQRTPAACWPCCRTGSASMV
jgi:retron-type reverse transcriptase